MRGFPAILLTGACALAASAAALAQPPACEGDAGSAQHARSEHYIVRFRFDPEPAVGQHFRLLLTVCGRTGPAAPDSVGVDARMPAHGHGMNYRPGITPLGAGGFRAEGLLLHMPGRWELEFLVREGGRAERVVHRLDLQ